MNRKSPPHFFDLRIDLQNQTLAELVIDTAEHGREVQRAVRAIHAILVAAQESGAIVSELEFDISKGEGGCTTIWSTTTVPPEESEHRGGLLVPESTPLGEVTSKCSVPVRKVFTRLKLRTVGDLVGKSAKEIISVRGAGEDTLKEIRTILAKLGGSLKGDEEKTPVSKLRLYTGSTESDTNPD